MACDGFTRSSLASVASRIAEERLGVIWDPEEPELPERITFGSAIIPAMPASLRYLYPDGGKERLNAAGYAEAVRRYNAWEAIGRLVDEAETGHRSYIDTVRDIHKILKNHV